MCNQATDGAAVKVGGSDGIGQYRPQTVSGLSNLGQAMLGEISASAQNFRDLLSRVCTNNRGFADANAAAVALQKIDEAEMWARKAVERR